MWIWRVVAVADKAQNPTFINFTVDIWVTLAVGSWHWHCPPTPHHKGKGCGYSSGGSMVAAEVLADRILILSKKRRLISLIHPKGYMKCTSYIGL